MKILKFVANHFTKVFLTTILFIIIWIINLFTNQYNPYTSFWSLYFPEKYLGKDIFIISKEYQYGGGGESGPQSYTFIGYLAKENDNRKTDLDWSNEDEVPWEIFTDTLINNKIFKTTPVFKSKLQNQSIYPIKDPTYLRDELIEDFLGCIFFQSHL